MSENQPSPFAPFQPSPTTQPESAFVPVKPETVKQTIAREKREAKTAAKNKPEAEKPSKKPVLKSHAPKFDLQTTLAAAKLLNEDDFPMFEKLVIMFDEAGKPQWDRVLAAVAKVFG